MATTISAMNIALPNDIQNSPEALRGRYINPHSPIPRVKAMPTFPREDMITFLVKPMRPSAALPMHSDERLKMAK